MNERILRLPAVLATVGVSKGRIYAWMAEGKFPRPVRLGVRAVGWRKSEINEWLESRPRAGIGLETGRSSPGKSLNKDATGLD